MERGLRKANLMVEELRDEIMELRAQVLALTEALAAGGAVDVSALRERASAALERLRAAADGVQIGDPSIDKYQATSPPIPCAELLPLCRARCCTLEFALSTQDLDEGTVRWDHGRPYMVLRRADGYCHHNEPDGFGCGVYAQRPLPCRVFDCRGDRRIWTDYDRRIPAPPSAIDDAEPDPPDVLAAEVVQRARTRQLALTMEDLALDAGEEGDPDLPNDAA
jgi:Fe-S-cluster containining protein